MHMNLSDIEIMIKDDRLSHNVGLFSSKEIEDLFRILLTSAGVLVDKHLVIRSSLVNNYVVLDYFVKPGDNDITKTTKDGIELYIVPICLVKSIRLLVTDGPGLIVMREFLNDKFTVFTTIKVEGVKDGDSEVDCFFWLAVKNILKKRMEIESMSDVPVVENVDYIGLISQDTLENFLSDIEPRVVGLNHLENRDFINNFGNMEERKEFSVIFRDTSRACFKRCINIENNCWRVYTKKGHDGFKINTSFKLLNSIVSG